MRAPGFWQKQGLIAAMLRPAGAVYGIASAWRMGQAAKLTPPVPVIAIGNLTVGGAGKTPTALALCGLLQDRGHNPAFVTRGYGGQIRGIHHVEPAADSAARVGDEPLLLAARARTIVAPDRAEGTLEAARSGADVVIFDDGFQNPSVAKALSIVVIDAGAGIGNGYVFPAGPLRAPLEAQLPHADAFVIIRDPGGRPLDAALERALVATARPCLAAAIVPEAPERFAGRRVVAYAGIGRPEKFAASLRVAGAEVVDLVAFADHHAFTPADARALLARGRQFGADLVTTSKDHVRLTGHADPALGDLARASLVLEVTLSLDDPGRLAALCEAAIRDFQAGR